MEDGWMDWWMDEVMMLGRLVKKRNTVEVEMIHLLQYLELCTMGN